MLLDIDYVVSEDQEILIVDQFTGRTMKAVVLRRSPQAQIEAKEGCRFRKNNKDLCFYHLSELFRMYKKLSGMTGTAKTEEEEFRETYNIRVFQFQPTVGSTY